MTKKTLSLLMMFPVLLISLSSSAEAEIVIENYAYLSAVPHGSFQGGPLDYIFQATAGSSVVRYDSPADTFLPFILYAELQNKSVLFGFFNYWTNAAACGQTGIVREANMVCNIWLRSLCPAADGWWRAINRTRYGLTGIAVKTSARYRAQCINEFPGPGGPCSLAPAAATVTMDLENGAVSRQEIPEHARPLLDRQEAKDGMFYTFERWSVEERDREPVLRVRDQSSHSRIPSPHFPKELRLDVPALPDGHTTTPSVAFSSEAHNVRLTPRTKVLVRAEFSPSGSLEGAETLRGDPEAGAKLAEALSVETRGADHRAVVYALFEGGPQTSSPSLIASVPVLPRCCCGSIACQ